MNKSERTGKNVYIEYLRFVFAIVIMIYHMRSFDEINAKSFCPSGRYAVEFFAILSGFLMARSLMKIAGNPTQEGVLRQSARFLRKKWRKLFVLHYVSYITAFITRQMVMTGRIGTIIKRWIRSLPELFLLSTTGIKTYRFNYNGADWYLAAMLLCMCIMVPVVIKWPKVFKICSFPLGVSVLMLLMKLFGSIRANESTWYGVLCLGNLRIMGDLLIGCSVYYIYDYLLPKVNLQGSSLLIIRIFLFVGYAFFIWFCFIGIPDSYGLIVVFSVAILLVLSFLAYGESCSSPSSAFIKIGMKLGAFSLPLYLNHRYWVFFLRDIPWQMPFTVKIILYAVLSVSSALLMNMLCNWILKKIDKHKHMKMSRNTENF